MNKFKKIFLIIWVLNIISFIVLFIVGKINNINFNEDFLFKYIKGILIIYASIDYFKFNLDECKVNSQINYTICLIICTIFLIAGVSFVLQLNYYRISEFLFFIIISTIFRLLGYNAHVPNFLLLKTN